MSTLLANSSYSRIAAEWFAALDLDRVPDDLVAHAKLRILDTLGVALAASALEYGAVIRDAARELGGPGPSHLLGFGDAANPVWAAMANGMMAHALIFDDTHNETIVHPSGPVLAAALAVGEATGATGRELLVSFIGGSELTCRIGLGAVGQFHKSGFQPTAIIGPMGAAYVASRMLRLDVDRTVHAVGISGSFASGINESWSDGTWAQLLHPGWAAHSGVAAALLAKNGYSGPSTVLEGRFGLFRSHVQKPASPFTFERIVDSLGTHWESRRMSFKPYPCGHVIHPFLDAVLALRRGGLRAAQVNRIVCPIAEYMIPVVCEPAHEKRRPKSDAQARTSLQFSLAEALVTGRLNATSYGAKNLRDPDILRLAERVEFIVDRTAPDSREYKGWVIVDTTDGRRLERVEPYNRGSPEHPLGEHEVLSKFRENSGLVLAGDVIEALIEVVRGLESESSLARAVHLCARP